MLIRNYDLTKHTHISSRFYNMIMSFGEKSGDLSEDVIKNLSVGVKT